MNWFSVWTAGHLGLSQKIFKAILRMGNKHIELLPDFSFRGLAVFVLL
jgi:hypothetical protein